MSWCSRFQTHCVGTKVDLLVSRHCDFPLTVEEDSPLITSVETNNNFKEVPDPCVSRIFFTFYQAQAIPEDISASIYMTRRRIRVSRGYVADKLSRFKLSYLHAVPNYITLHATSTELPDTSHSCCSYTYCIMVFVIVLGARFHLRALRKRKKGNRRCGLFEGPCRTDG